MKKILLLSSVTLLFFSFTGEKKAYVIYNSKGKVTSYKNLLDAAKEADIVMFGEEHDNPICHWLELELTKDLYNFKKNNLVLGAEMFERDQQNFLTEYLDGKISDKVFRDTTNLWSNFGTDYKPLVDFAKDNHLAFIATNVPRRYANMVYKHGLSALDTLKPNEKNFIAPLPIKYDSTVRAYKEIFENAGGHGGQNLPKAQALKDATMAYFLLQNWKPGETFIHYNGAYHSNNHSGLVWYLGQSNPSLKILVISSTTQSDISKIDSASKGSGDFIICIPDDMTRTME
ncbi:MAG: ChaN family lipoprotein [Bacteroidetes bacterium]|nr:ChaN family lipoprotein [Bacteroidota bacterium]